MAEKKVMYMIAETEKQTSAKICATNTEDRFYLPHLTVINCDHLETKVFAIFDRNTCHTHTPFITFENLNANGFCLFVFFFQFQSNGFWHL